MVDHIQAMQEEVRQKLETTNAKYKEAVDKKRCDKIFSVGGLVLVYLKKERFPAGTYNKLKGKKYRPFQITKKITNNDCVVALPTDMNISSTFNVADLYDYYPLDVPGNGNSGSSSFQVGEIDVEQAVMAFLDSCALLKTMRRQKGTSRNHGPRSQNCMKFGGLKRNGLLSNSHCIATSYPYKWRIPSFRP